MSYRQVVNVAGCWFDSDEAHCFEGPSLRETLYLAAWGHWLLATHDEWFLLGNAAAGAWLAANCTNSIRSSPSGVAMSDTAEIP